LVSGFAIERKKQQLFPPRLLPSPSLGNAKEVFVLSFEKRQLNEAANVSNQRSEPDANVNHFQNERKSELWHLNC
jgi:hypothetical protein